MKSKVPLLEEFDPGDEGTFQRIDKNVLRVDNGVSGYQRKKLEEKARKIADKFEWSKFGVLMVNKRAGKLWIYDGQQRHAASLLIPAIKRVPCIVFEKHTRHEEAADFIGTDERTKLRPLDKWRAELIAKNDLAIQTNAVLKRFGFDVGRCDDGFTFECPTDLKDLQRQNCLAEVLQILVEAWPDAHERTLASVLSGTGRFFRRANKKLGVSPRDVAVRLRKKSLPALLQSGLSLAYAHNSSGRDGFCRALQAAWNKGLSPSNRISDADELLEAAGAE